MPNRKVHVITSGLAGVGVAALEKKCIHPLEQLSHLVGGAVGGVIGGRTPDVLEPATSPCHRQCFHGIVPCGSVVTFGGAFLLETYRKLIAWAESAPGADTSKDQPIPLDRCFRFFVAGAYKGFLAGYAVHLLLDSRTPKGLPIVGKLGLAFLNEIPARIAA